MKHSFKIVALAIIALFAGVAAYAQVTTSSIAGKITDTKGEVVPGAVVVAVHVPSGTQYHAVTGAQGRYTIQGMRPGGPYNVTVSLMGYEEAKISDVALQLGETANIAPVLREAALALEESVVVAEGGMDAGKTGASQTIGRRTIEEMPSITRGIADVTRINPFVRVDGSGAMSFAGASNKYNSFQIDGAMNNDVFGLTASGSNGGQAGTQPVSMETIEQLQVSVAPFDVRQSGFTGGSINAITKSGTNQFHGSVYGFGNNQSIIGRYTLANGEKSDKYHDQKEYQAGVTISGPIIKNKLFFFASFERSSKEYPNVYGLGAEASLVDPTDASDVLKIAQAAGYKGELPTDLQEYTKSDKATVKLDWNVNAKNHASFRWSMVDAKQLNSTSGAKALNASDYSYDFLSKTNSFVGELQSQLSDNMSNELRVSYVRVRDKRNPLGENFPMISVSVKGGTVNLGNERSSVANRLDQDIYSLTDNLTKYLGNHTVTFGTHNEIYKFTNLFIQDKYGTYYFASPADMQNGVIKQYRYAHANAAVTGTENWEPTFWAGQFSFYLQDKWSLTDRFDLTYGVRADVPVFFDIPDENVPFTAYAADRGWNVRTNQMPKSAPLVAPRVGFRWDIAGDRKYVLRGGAGFFTGRIPFVWFSNNYSNTGVQLTAINVQRSSNAASAAACDAMKVIYNPAGQAPNEEIAKNFVGSQTINVMDPEFKLAKTGKLDLGFDFRALGIDWTLEGIYTKTFNDIRYEQMAYDLNGKTVGSTYASIAYDQRPMFSRVTGGSQYANIYKLTNTDKGYSYNLMVQAAKHFGFGLDLNASYTFTQSKSVFNGGSSVAQSNFAYNYTNTNPNDPELGFSAYNIPHQIKVAATYHKSYGRNDRWTTSLGAVYIGTSGAAWSIYYYGDLNGDSSNGNDLMFIPTDAQIDQMTFKTILDKKGNVKRTPEEQAANMKAWLAGERYLKDHRGEYYDRYADNMPFENHVDIHVGQKFSFKVGQQVHSLELTADIINFTNMLNPKWGRSYGMGINSYFSPVKYSGNGQFQFAQPATYQMMSYSDYLSRWRGQIGLKYTF